MDSCGEPWLRRALGPKYAFWKEDIMATSQATIVLSGNVGTIPTRYAQESGTPCISFRMASTGGYWNRATQQWQEFPTTWVRVKAFWSLATNVLQSLHVGEPIVVSGTLVSEQWQKDGVQHSGLVILADTIGHDLNRGVSVFTKRAQHASKTTTAQAVEQSPSASALDSNASSSSAEHSGSEEHEEQITQAAASEFDTAAHDI
ncbi:single-stranded DNA-binding protein [Galliscardovia ingluviei]|nr:single-stranded DNA-binding protein [Galliscardovia ingluviei]